MDEEEELPNIDIDREDNGAIRYYDDFVDDPTNNSDGNVEE